ncbi:unnamed protein product [Rhizophagus irregularis]|nr:unnamed protein product [Rhizophagus irregularis]
MVRRKSNELEKNFRDGVNEELDLTDKFSTNIFQSSSIIIVQPPFLPATTEIGKQPLGDSVKGQNNLNIISTTHKNMKNIMKLNKDESSYSNPENFLSLPYPYSGKKLPIDRFDIHVTFMGRKKFKQVLRDINKLQPRYYMMLSFDPVNYVKLALFLTYHDNDMKISEINACKDFCQIINFCRLLDEKLYFIVNQMNALDELDNTGVSLEKKKQTRENLNKVTNHHYYLLYNEFFG